MTKSVNNSKANASKGGAKAQVINAVSNAVLSDYSLFAKKYQPGTVRHELLIGRVPILVDWISDIKCILLGDSKRPTVMIDYNDTCRYELREKLSPVKMPCANREFSNMVVDLLQPIHMEAIMPEVFNGKSWIPMYVVIDEKTYKKFDTTTMEYVEHIIKLKTDATTGCVFKINCTFKEATARTSRRGVRFSS